jgi:hypothetical protein
MTTASEVSSNVPPGRRSSVLPWLGGVLIGVVLATLLCAAAIWMFRGSGMLAMLRGSHPRFDVVQPTVVRQIQQLQRLETVTYTMDKIISGERNNPYLPNVFVGDRLLLVVHGEVIAGVNLANLHPSDVKVEEHKLSIHLPAPEIFTTRIDNQKTRVYSRDTGLFSSPDPNLETEVRQEAERQLQQAALQDGILRSADQNARNTVSSLLKGLGFTSVEFN